MTSQQILKHWHKETNRTWDELRKRYRLPIPVPQPNRDEIDADFRDEIAVACEAELPALLAQHRELVEKKVQSLARFYVAVMRKYKLSGVPRQGNTSKPRESRNVCRDFSDGRYLRILEFVSQRSVSLAGLLGRSLETSGRRISWDGLIAEWNKAIPKDPLSADTLRRYYYRARADSNLCQRYFDDLLDGWAKAAQPLIDMFMEAGCRAEDLFIKRVMTKGTHPPDTNGLPPELAEAERRMYECKEWIEVGPRFSPEVEMAYQLAADRNCALMARFFAFPRDARLCQGPHCRRCKVGVQLERFSLAGKDELCASAAAAAVERWRERLRNHAETMRMIRERAWGTESSQ